MHKYIESLTTLVLQMSHQMSQLTAAGGHPITPVAKTVSPLGNRWGNGNQLHQQVPNYANKNVLDETLRQREALMATAAFAHKMANNPEILTANYNGKNHGRPPNNPIPHIIYPNIPDAL